MKKMHVMTIVGTRPELIKLSRVIAELDEHTKHTLVHTGQNYAYELNEIFFKDLGIRKPDHFLNIATDKTTAAEAAAAVISHSDKVMRECLPDAILVLGDTNSCLSVYCAKRLKIPVFHMEAGNRCFDERVPEEINRRMIDHISDVNLTYTEHARRYLLREGLRPELIIKTGSPMHEVILFYKDNIEQSKILNKLKLTKNNYFVVSVHREENVDNQANFIALLQALNLLAEKHNKTIIVSTHPRTKKRLQALDKKQFKADEKIHFLDAMGFCDYIKLQLNACCVISDSGSITEEASILNLPAVTVRQAHERPEGMDVGTLIMTGMNSDNILNAVEVVMKQHQEQQRTFSLVPDYQSSSVSKQVLRIILSYTDYINRVIWRKS